ncbi:hypothetical protein PR048_009819 [Dryococelus australis]|uniref:Uncharacterized protein n=1 Tax=Dryococelus australis TaxID=614101 RepID=A0ABQ9I0Y4_9NEOP|nr:hypothetical protein PR048_009819 [Dryococelus australis]
MERHRNVRTRENGRSRIGIDRNDSHMWIILKRPHRESNPARVPTNTTSDSGYLQCDDSGPVNPKRQKGELMVLQEECLGTCEPPWRQKGVGTQRPSAKAVSVRFPVGSRTIFARGIGNVADVTVALRGFLGIFEFLPSSRPIASRLHFTPMGAEELINERPRDCQLPPRYNIRGIIALEALAWGSGRHRCRFLYQRVCAPYL